MSGAGRQWVPTEPGSPMARAHGCTCPGQKPRPIRGGGTVYTLADDCPLHRRPHAPPNFNAARVQEDRRERERGAAA